MSTTQKDDQDVARQAMKAALAKGAKEAAATISRTREVSVEWRDGKVERINEAIAILRSGGAGRCIISP